MENKNTKIITGAIIGAAILVAAIIIAVVLPHVMLVNQQVLDLYNKANEAIIRDEDGYGGYYVTTNQECRNYIGQAKETMAHSMFVKPSLKRQVNDLDDYIKHYDALNEVLKLVSWNDFKTAEEKMKYAEERKEIKDSAQYDEIRDGIADCYIAYVIEEVDKANYERISKRLDDLMAEHGVSSSTKNSVSYSGTWGMCGKIVNVSKSLYWSGYDVTLSNMSGEFYINPSKSDFIDDYNNNANGFEIAAIVSGDTMTHMSWYRTRLTAADIGLPEYYNDYVAQGYPEPKKLNTEEFLSISTTTASSSSSSTTASSSEGVSDETFGQIQDLYAQLVDLHNTIVDATNNGQLQLNDEQTKYVNEAADLINEMGELDKSQFKSEDDAVAIAESIGQLAEALGTLVGA